MSKVCNIALLQVFRFMVNLDALKWSVQWRADRKLSLTGNKTLASEGKSMVHFVTCCEILEYLLPLAKDRRRPHGIFCERNLKMTNIPAYGSIIGLKPVSTINRRYNFLQCFCKTRKPFTSVFLLLHKYYRLLNPNRIWANHCRVGDPEDWSHGLSCTVHAIFICRRVQLVTDTCIYTVDSHCLELGWLEFPVESNFYRSPELRCV